MTTPNADEQDQAAMERLAKGDDTALETLMNRHAERLFHYLIRVLQNEARAADLAEEAFVRVYQNRLKFRPKHRFTTWLYTIATNLARDLQRYQARHPQLSLDGNQDGTGADFYDRLAEPRPDPGEALESVERSDAVRRAVATLSEELRVPLILATYEEKSHAEIAEILRCSPKAVEMRLYRARSELRVLLGKVLA